MPVVVSSGAVCSPKESRDVPIAALLDTDGGAEIKVERRRGIGGARDWVIMEAGADAVDQPVSLDRRWIRDRRMLPERWARVVQWLHTHGGFSKQELTDLFCMTREETDDIVYGFGYYSTLREWVGSSSVCRDPTAEVLPWVVDRMRVLAQRAYWRGVPWTRVYEWLGGLFVMKARDVYNYVHRTKVVACSVPRVTRRGALHWEADGYSALPLAYPGSLPEHRRFVAKQGPVGDGLLPRIVDRDGECLVNINTPGDGLTE